MSQKLSDMIRGWFVGDFEPTVYKTSNCEVGYKKYKKGDREDLHYHLIATEITVVIKGAVLMRGKRYGSGKIIVIEPKESTDFIALSDADTIVVKVPGVLGDKYLGDYIEC